MPFLLPPKDEQSRIVAKIEELFSDLDAGVAALNRAKGNLKRYRASVLKAAVEGKLTEEWRARHPATEPASALLARILKERRQKWEADQLAKFAAADKEPPKTWREKYVEPTPPKTTVLPSIPNSWTWATLDAIADVVGGITKDQKKANQPGMREIPYLRVANVQRGFLDLSEMKSISATEDDIADFRLEAGDVLFTEGGDRDKLGRGWVWTGELSECIHQNHIFRGRLLSQDMQPRFVSHHGNTFGKEWFIKAGKQTTNLASINLGILRQFPVPIPPAAEQAEIIAQVDETLSQIDAAEMQIEHGLIRASRLRQSILKQAFEGKLVPQDPRDEPASTLLARLAENRTQVGQSATKPKAARRKAMS
jgi:type I restriction enzyme S subunit